MQLLSLCCYWWLVLSRKLLGLSVSHTVCLGASLLGSNQVDRALSLMNTDGYCLLPLFFPEITFL